VPVVAVDANPLTRAAITGTELYARELCRRLPGAAPDLTFRLFAARPAAGAEVDLTVAPLPRLWTQVRLPVELARLRPDLLFVPAHAVPFATRTPAVMTVHDLAYEKFPQAYRPAQLAYLRAAVAWAARRCRLLVTVSHATRADLVQQHGVDPERVVVVHPGGGEQPLAADLELDRRLLSELDVKPPFLVHVGRVERRKNQVTAARAARRAGLPLVSAGPVADEDTAAEHSRIPGCRILGPVSAAARDALYRSALALLFPSLYEGFGFPVLEAMRHGLPVITAATSSLPEVGGQAALYAEDARDVDALAELVEQVRDDPRLRAQLAEAGRAQASRFSWDACAGGVAAVLREALA
jgi:glycosyltransferase involved in cell wall biosynthesis